MSLDEVVQKIILAFAFNNHNSLRLKERVKELVNDYAEERYDSGYAACEEDNAT